MTEDETATLNNFIDKFEEVYQLWLRVYPILVAHDYEPNWVPKLNEFMGSIYEERQYIHSALITEE